MTRAPGPLIAVLVIAAVAFVYRAAPGAYFFEDDFHWLVGTWTYDPATILRPGSHTHFYRPVIELYFWLATPLFGGSVTIFHVANIVLHAVNGLLLFAVAREISGSTRFAMTTALLFVVLPGYVQAVAWVSALAEPVGAFFGCLTLLGFLRFRRERRISWLGLSLAAFALALLTHESSVVILVLVALVEWASGEARKGEAASESWMQYWLGTARACLPYALLVAAYLAIDLPINRRSYIIGEGHYRIGFHAVRNVLGYIVSLYVGKRSWLTYGVVSLVLGWLLIRGNRRTRFAIVWMLVSLMPFAFFTWGNTSRYLYLPGMGFALLVAEGVEWLDARLGRVLSDRRRAAAIGLLVAILTIRFAVFASKGVSGFRDMTDDYRQFLTTFRQAHPTLPTGSHVPIDPKDAAALTLRNLQALVQWEYRDPTITLVESR